MKFTNEDAYKKLVAKLTANGEKLNLSQRSINEQIEALLPLVANDEMELDDFVDKVLPLVKTANSNVRNDVSQGIKDYINQHPKDTQPNPAQTPQTTTTTSNIQDDLIKRLEALENLNKQQELELKVRGIKSQLTNKLKELGVKSDKWLESLIANINIEEDFNVEEKAQGYLELYNIMQSEIDINVTPVQAGNGKHDYISDSIKDAASIAKSQSMIG